MPSLYWRVPGSSHTPLRGSLASPLPVARYERAFLRRLLYACPVYCVVYCQRAQGKERPQEWVRRSAARGDLRFEVGHWDERPWRVVMRGDRPFGANRCASGQKIQA